MPMYKYLCEDCGGITKVSRRMTEQKTPNKCTHCGSRKLSRVYSPVGMSVKATSPAEDSTCCGRDSPCSTPPCSDGGVCQKY